MKNIRHFRRLAAVTVAVVIGGTASAFVLAQPKSPPQGTYGGWGCDMGAGPGSGYGMGPGMMGDFDQGPGMMGGYGMGLGWMRGFGMGHGMMGPYWGGRIDLSDEQQAKINKIQDETRKAHWALMGAMMDQEAKLRDLYSAPIRDTAAIDGAYKTLGKLRQEMYDSAEDARKRMDTVLTPEQHEKLRSTWRRGWAPSR